MCVGEDGLWLATGTQDVLVAGRRITSEPTLRSLGIILGADRVEERVATAWRAFWSQKQ